jgi:hypothetical protein
MIGCGYAGRTPKSKVLGRCGQLSQPPVSGASRLRPGIQALPTDALPDRFEVVLAAALAQILGHGLEFTL